jgi:hypothetical protein
VRLGVRGLAKMGTWEDVSVEILRSAKPSGAQTARFVQDDTIIPGGSRFVAAG